MLCKGIIKVDNNQILFDFDVFDVICIYILIAVILFMAR